MSEHYDFHYQPTGSGAISGQQVLEQTEDAINELGDYVNDNVGGAMDVAQQALETAQNAEQDAQTALDTANSFSSAIQSAQQDASTALSTAQTAQTTASNANNTALQAQQDASSAVTTANNASGQVSTLSGTVTALGQRVTTAEGNIGQNTSDITALTTRVGTAEGNITTLQNDVSVAMGNASSAMATAGTVKQQAYVFRYSSTALVASSTNSNALLDNTDNLKVGDKVIDSDGVLFSITAIDSVNSTFTIGTALVDLAQDSDVVHNSGNETISGIKTFDSNTYIYNSDTNATTPYLFLKNSKTTKGSASEIGAQILRFIDKNNNNLCDVESIVTSTGSCELRLRSNTLDSNNQDVQTGVTLISSTNGSKRFCPTSDNNVFLGANTLKWSRVYSTEYYYGSNNVEFSQKFVTTDTAQTVSGAKTFSDNLTIYNSDNTQTPKGLAIRNAQWGMGESGGTTASSINFLDKNSAVPASIIASKGSGGQSFLRFSVRTKDSQNNTYAEEIYYDIDTSGNVEFRSWHDNIISLGTSVYKWKDVQTNLINGLTPSSLGMPMTRDNAIDISSYFTNFNNGETNQYTPTVNGWIFLDTSGCNALHCFCMTTNNLTHYGSTVARGVDGLAYVTFPVLANTVFKCIWYTNSTITLNKAWFIPCQGNV